MADRDELAVDVAAIARTLPYRESDVQQAHDYLKRTIEATAAIAMSQNLSLDTAAHMIGDAIKSRAFPTLVHANAMGCKLTVQSKGNCLELTVPEGWRMVIRESEDAPGRLTWVWMELER